MECLILAAGEGKRLRPYTQTQPKCMVPLLGKRLISYQQNTLESVGINSISIVSGYQAEKLRYLQYPMYHNKNYHSTNMVTSLFCALKVLECASDDLIISYGDIVYEKRNIKKLLNTSGDIVLMIDDGWHKLWSLRNENPISDAETLKLNAKDEIIEIGKKPNDFSEIQGQYTGLIKISKAKIRDLISLYYSLDHYQTYDGQNFANMYMTSLLQICIENGWVIKPAHVRHGWLEVDTVNDLLLYEKLAEQDALQDLWNSHA